MNARFLFGVVLGLMVIPGRGFAEDNDLLAPLTPSKKSSAPAAKKKPAANAARKGRLAVTVHGASDATVWVDDAELGPASSEPYAVSAGTHQVMVRRAGYADFTRTLSVRPGKVTEVSAQLEPSGGILLVESSPDGAQVLVDGQPIGNTPLKNVVLPAGTYEVRLRKDGFRDEQTRVSIRLGKEQALRLSLKGAQDVMESSRSSLLPADALEQSGEMGRLTTSVEEGPAWHRRWYVWAGVATVVAASVTTFVVVRNANGRQPLNVVCAGAARCGSF